MTSLTTRNEYPIWYRYGVALIAVVLVAVLRAAAYFFFGTSLPYSAFCLAVILVAYFMGFGPSLLAVALTAFAAAFWVEPTGVPLLSCASGITRFAMLLAVNLLIVWICESMRRATHRAIHAEASRASAELLAEQARALQASEQRLRATFDNAGVGILEVENDDHFVAANDRACEILGYSREELLQMTVTDVTAPEDRAYSAQTNAELHRGIRDRIEYEKHYIKKDGSRHWIHVTVSAVRTPSGQWSSSIATIEDIGERKRAEEALRNSQEQLRLLVEQAPVTVAMFDRNMNYIATSRRWLALYGRGHVDLTGLNHYDIKPDMPEYWREVHRQGLAGVSQECEEDKWVMADGTVNWLRWAVHPWRNIHQEIGGIIISVEDITPRKQAEEALQQSEAFLRTVCETTPDAIFAKDRESRVLFANSGMLRELGKSPGEVIGRRDDEFHTRPEYAQAVLENDRRVMESGIAEAFEETIETPNGSRTFLCTKAPNRDSDGNIIGLIGVARDITDRKRAEEVVLKAKEEAEAANRAKDQFLAVLSHELRTPLTPALMIVGAHEADMALPADLREDLGTVRRNLELETRLIDDLLDLNRLARGKIELNLQPGDLHRTLRNVMVICRSEIVTKGLNLQLELSAVEHNVNRDGGRLQQVFWNLLKNATKFTSAGGTIIVRTLNPRPEIVRVEVADTGMGINPQAIPRLFVAFEQGGTGITQQFGGLGLGLAICKAVVDLHGGEIRAYSEGHGKGATFVVELPTTSSQVPIEAGAHPSGRTVNWNPQINGRPLKILLVEDNADTLRILSRLLEKAGCRVTSAHCIETALEAAAAARDGAGEFDLVISDLGLPDGDGRDLMRQLRDRDGLSGIAISGFGMEDDMAKSCAAGFAEHLTKPIQLEALQGAIFRLVDNGSKSQ